MNCGKRRSNPALPAAQHPATSHSSQEATAGRVLVHVETNCG
jgi:hypothetical protein